MRSIFLSVWAFLVISDGRNDHSAPKPVASAEAGGAAEGWSAIQLKQVNALHTLTRWCRQRSEHLKDLPQLRVAEALQVVQDRCQESPEARQQSGVAAREQQQRLAQWSQPWLQQTRGNQGDRMDSYKQRHGRLGSGS